MLDLSQTTGIRAAGIAYRLNDGRLLFMKRTESADHGRTWATPGGSIDAGETPEQAARREFREETGQPVTSEIRFVEARNGFAIYECKGDEFTPTVTDEHTAFLWALPDNPPQPLHPGLEESLQKMTTAPENQNARDYPKIYYARHMQPGVCGYQNETILVDTDAVKAMLLTAIGKPVFINHAEESPQEQLETIKENAAGYITDAFYNELDGWAWFKIIVVDDKAKELIGHGWKCSNAYIPKKWAGGGTKNNVPYNREVIEAIITHLAIVINPRYEDANVLTVDEFKAYQEAKRIQNEELKNSKETKNEKGKPMSILNFFKTEKKPTSEIDMDTQVEFQNSKGETISAKFSDMVTAFQNSKDEADCQKMNDDSEVDVDGEKMTLKELVNRYQKLNTKKNEDEAAEKAKKEAEEKKNAEEAEAKKKAEADEETKENSAGHFEQLKNAADKAALENSKPRVVSIETGSLKTARGKERYGSGA